MLATVAEACQDRQVTLRRGDRMRRREVIAAVAGGTAWSIPALAQAPSRRIAVLLGIGENDPGAKQRVAALVQGLGELGWDNGQNIKLEFRFTSEVERMRAYASEAVALQPDVIVVHS